MFSFKIPVPVRIQSKTNIESEHSPVYDRSLFQTARFNSKSDSMEMTIDAREAARIEEIQETLGLEKA